MSPEREALLAARHPSYVAAQLQDGASACGDGWFDVVDRLLTSLEARNLDGFKPIQIKQKMGKLRFYAFGLDDEAEAAIQAASEESASICESCGEPGMLGGGRWLSSRCEQHRDPPEEEAE